MPAQRRPSFAFGALALTLFALSCGSTGSGGIGAMSCSAGRGPASASDAIVLRNFTLIDGGDHEPVPQAAMVVEQGRISWVGRGADLKAPDGAATTDLNGAYMIRFCSADVGRAAAVSPRARPPEAHRSG